MLNNKKGLKELFPDSKKQLNEYNKPENKVQRNRRYTKNSSKIRRNLRNSKIINKEINKIHTQEPPATNIKYRYHNNTSTNPYKNQENIGILNKTLLCNFYEYFKVKKGTQILNLFNAIVIATVYTVMIVLLTSPIMGLIFFTLLFSVIFTGLNESFILDELKNAKNIKDTEKTLAIKELNMKITFLILSLGLAIPFILMYNFTIL